MKKIIYLLWIAFVATVFVACEDEGPLTIINSNIAANELKAPSSDAFVLTSEDKDNALETFQWTAPDYGFKAAVTYVLQMDYAENGFAEPITLATTNDLEATVTVGEINELLLGLGLTPEEASAMEMRVVSSISDKVADVISNTRTVSFTPYATSFPPIYGMGDGLKGWGPWPDKAVEWQSTEYKKYETTAYFTNGKAFRWFAQLDWNPTSYNYPFFTTVSPVFENANDGDKNFKIVGATGWYKVSVDLGAKTVAAEAVAEPQLFMVGAAVGGWDQSKAVKMTYIKPGVFEGEANFTVETFRFFAQNDWGPTSYNYPYFTTVDPMFVNANDGDKNFKFIGTPGTLKLTVDLNNKTVTVGDIPDPVMYMTGAALNGWSWDPGKPVSMTYLSPGIWEATATFTSGETFRFFAQADWGPTSYNYPYFTTVSADFENANDGDKNFKYVGATGSRKITIDLNTKAVTLE
jgi:starch-binding outer membrane protein SusE/F